jgi:trehalose 6-phosphate phosphatase
MSSNLSPSLNSAPVSLRDCAFFLDFDGTLAPLQDDPDTVSLPNGGASLLLALNTKLSGAMVLISGRDIRDLSKRTPVELLRAGGHGLEVCQPGETPALAQTSTDPRVRQRVEDLVAPHPGVRIEDKGPVLAVHFRQNPAVEAELLAALKALAETLPDYKAQHGKMVIELKPTRANKGMALASLMQSAPFSGRKPIMVGDDTTDEDAMRTATDLGGFGIKVGEGETCAKFRVKDPEAVWDWLRRLVDEHT